MGDKAATLVANNSLFVEDYAAAAASALNYNYMQMKEIENFIHRLEEERYSKLEELVKVPSKIREQAECLRREASQLYKEIKRIEYNIVWKKAETKVLIWFERENDIIDTEYVNELEKSQDEEIEMMWNDIEMKRLEGEVKSKESRELMKSGARKVREAIKKEIADIDLMTENKKQLYSFYEQQSMIWW
ncbi:hypothetical protein RhiirA5_354144 [Rhizophagus irregularis]|uniref:Uncharacterized protein n=2 Tax=Rhizophagus irregularis TaxID=588596 RepID=A0A2I1EZH4_9GLOM|nr:hypothetical protein GLOIN_2v1569105 [Rhizophagus irregularis DAOM 181602=DAOM 197198]PKC11447.1 hypothetical protein RhiirA5_354144 [Rhizophagus irregularis]PKC68343.1 hypothetical protein RhiirA1_416997 [Rhizophagus irregularis]PKK74305.1 hypothetical protein RhiirC2_739150 [Rhizophagus irregularis]PKY27519.1 hypothetical protein RhiirB3_416094 [Rhizophagus irregularis]POG75161.1 hypothetical protein GLOIN_2v1569105 [Rhizophagus irregularis DAOM 181602=DAOM 197198]|eukprot:XP_025182027.1 hypothetical protein GLOIN_2v1569105 [Rhizophagus irregularis DAOM 181602=DAOM 197198]